MKTIVVPEGAKVICEHGSPYASSKIHGTWNGGVAMCQCCKSTYGYIDSCYWSEWDMHWKSFSKDRCARCGGKYTETTERVKPPPMSYWSTVR
jgi:hypothetical protein